MRRWPELALAVLLLAAAATPFWAGRFLPFLDLPQHLGLAAVVARFDDPSTAFARYYEIDRSVTPYWGYYGAMWMLARVVPLELANRLLFLLAAHARGARGTLARAVPFLPSLALFASWAWPRFVRPERAGVEEHTVLHRTYGALGGLGARFEPWGDVVRKLPERLF